MLVTGILGSEDLWVILKSEYLPRGKACKLNLGGVVVVSSTLDKQVLKASPILGFWCKISETKLASNFSLEKIFKRKSLSISFPSCFRRLSFVSALRSKYW